MQPEEIINRFKQALETFAMREQSLLRRNASERAMTGRLQGYLAPLFHEYDVDVEYNRNMGQPKTIKLEDGRNRNPLPDIIVHERESNENNLLMIEAKLSSSSESQAEDKLKIEAFARPPYNYTVGILLTFMVGNDANSPNVNWRAYYNFEWHQVSYQ